MTLQPITSMPGTGNVLGTHSHSSSSSNFAVSLSPVPSSPPRLNVSQYVQKLGNSSSKTKVVVAEKTRSLSDKIIQLGKENVNIVVVESRDAKAANIIVLVDQLHAVYPMLTFDAEKKDAALSKKLRSLLETYVELCFLYFILHYFIHLYPTTCTLVLLTVLNL